MDDSAECACVRCGCCWLFGRVLEKRRMVFGWTATEDECILDETRQCDAQRTAVMLNYVLFTRHIMSCLAGQFIIVSIQFWIIITVIDFQLHLLKFTRIDWHKWPDNMDQYASRICRWPILFTLIIGDDDPLFLMMMCQWGGHAKWNSLN